MDDAASLGLPLDPGRAKVVARRQQILEAACERVRRSGFHGASMAEIAQASGLSVGQIYRYFANKEAIVAAIVEQDLAEMRAKFAKLETADGSMVGIAIEQFVGAMERNYDPARAALMLEVLAEAARNPRVGAIVREADAAERAVGQRLLDRISPSTGRSQAETAARGEVLSMMFEGMAMRAVSNPNGDRAEIGRVLTAVVRMLLSDLALSPDLTGKQDFRAFKAAEAPLWALVTSSGATEPIGPGCGQ
jgi:AcrR family transcriptional regulator